MVKGYGIEASDWVLIAALALGGFFAYKMVVKPVSDVTQTAANVVTGPGKAVSWLAESNYHDAVSSWEKTKDLLEEWF